MTFFFQITRDGLWFLRRCHGCALSKDSTHCKTDRSQQCATKKHQFHCFLSVHISSHKRVLHYHVLVRRAERLKYTAIPSHPIERRVYQDVRWKRYAATVQYLQ